MNTLKRAHLLFYMKDLHVLWNAFDQVCCQVTQECRLSRPVATNKTISPSKGQSDGSILQQWEMYFLKKTESLSLQLNLDTKGASRVQALIRCTVRKHFGELI